MKYKAISVSGINWIKLCNLSKIKEIINLRPKTHQFIENASKFVCECTTCVQKFVTKMCI